MKTEIKIHVSHIDDLNRALDETKKEATRDNELWKVQSKLKDNTQMELDELREVHAETTDEVVALRDKNQKLENIVQELKQVYITGPGHACRNCTVTRLTAQKCFKNYE